MKAPIPYEELRARIARSPYHTWAGATLEEVEEGRVVMRVDLEHHHLNPQGIVHGGVIAGLLDSVCGLSLRTILPADVSHRTVQLSITYLKAARTGVIRGIGTAVHESRRVGFAEGEVRDTDDNLLARASATFFNLPG